MDLESRARELKMLADRERLSPLELDRAKSLMVELKQQGMLNPEIVELTGGRWSESTVKGYTKGVRATDPEPWKSTTALFSEMLSRNLTLAEVSRAMTITTELEGMGSSLSDMVGFMQQLEQKEISPDQLAEAVNLNAELDGIGTSPGEIASFLRELEEESVDTSSFVLLFHDWHEVGLTAAEARSALNYKQQLESTGFDSETLPGIGEAAARFGSPLEVLQALVKYGTLRELDEELETRREEMKTLAAEMESHSQGLDAAGRQLAEVRNEIATMEKGLATYRRLEAIGFDEKALGELAKAIEKYGTPRKVLKAVNGFGDLSKIKAIDDELRNKLKQKRAMVKSLDEEYSHLKEPIELCKTLLKRRFGLTALHLINMTAWRYGEPTEVLKAIEAYGALKEIEKKTDQAKAALAEIKGKVEAEKETHAEYSARNGAMLDQFEALNAKAIEVGRAVGAVQEQAKKDTMARDVLNLLQNPTSAGYDEYLPLALVVLNSVSVWANVNKSRFAYFSLFERNLKEAMGGIGGS